MTWTNVADALAAVFLLCGAFLAFAAGVGVARFPDLLARMHAATKPQVLGLILMLTGLSLRVRSWPAVAMVVLVVVFQLLTSPVAAHLVGRAGYRTGKVRTDLLVIDELTRDQEAAEAASGRSLGEPRPAAMDAVDAAGEQPSGTPPGPASAAGGSERPPAS